MTLIDRARHLLTCDELRGQLPDEVAEFLREVVALKPVGYLPPSVIGRLPSKKWIVFDAFSRVYSDAALYTLETPHDAG